MAPRDLAPATGGTTMIYGSIQQKTTKKQGKEKRGNTMELKGPVFWISQTARQIKHNLA
jgi:hypothetical protein